MPLPEEEQKRSVASQSSNCRCGAMALTRGENVGVSQQKPKGTVAAAVVGTLSPGDVGKPFTDADRVAAMVPHDWQMLGAMYEWAEIHGVTSGLPHGYLSDLLGRAAAAGEQLGLAFAALRDAEVWRDTKVGPEYESRRTIAGRAMAEASGLWAVSAGHAAVNVVARVVRIHSNAAGLDTPLRWDGLPKPFDAGREANLSLNAEIVQHILKAAKTTGELALVEFVEPLHTLTRDLAWAALKKRRDAGYHRLRPQSIDGGVPSENPWIADTAAGALTMSVSMFSSYIPPTIDDVVEEAEAGYGALSSAMRNVHDRLPAAMRAAGAPIWR
jgi:hypothetical protein